MSAPGSALYGEIATGLKCQPGSVVLAAFDARALVGAPTDARSITDPWALDIAFAATSAAGQAAREWCVVRLYPAADTPSDPESYDEWAIMQRKRTVAAGADVVACACRWPDVYLARGGVLQDRTTDGRVVQAGGADNLPASGWLAGYVVPASVPASRLCPTPAWVSAGTVEVTEPVALTWTTPPTPHALLDDYVAAVRKQGALAEWSLRRTGTTGYAIDVLRRRGGGAPVAELSTANATVRTLDLGTDVTDQATVATASGADDGTGAAATLGTASWAVTAVGAGVGTLADPNGGADPVFADGCVTGLSAYRESTRGTFPITASVAAVGATPCQIACDLFGGATTAVGERVGLRAGPPTSYPRAVSGHRLYTVGSPTAGSPPTVTLTDAIANGWASVSAARYADAWLAPATVVGTFGTAGSTTDAPTQTVVFALLAAEHVSDLQAGDWLVPLADTSVSPPTPDGPVGEFTVDAVDATARRCRLVPRGGSTLLATATRAPGTGWLVLRPLSDAGVPRRIRVRTHGAPAGSPGVATVSVATLTGLASGQVVEVLAEAGAPLLAELAHPLGVQPPPVGYGRVTAHLDRSDVGGPDNLVRNATFRTWSTAASPTVVAPDGVTVGGLTAERVRSDAPSGRALALRATWRVAGVALGAGATWIDLVPVTIAVLLAGDVLTLRHDDATLEHLTIGSLTTSPADPTLTRMAFTAAVVTATTSGALSLAMPGDPATAPAASCEVVVPIATAGLYSGTAWLWSPVATSEGAPATARGAALTVTTLSGTGGGGTATASVVGQWTRLVVAGLNVTAGDSVRLRVTYTQRDTPFLPVAEREVLVGALGLYAGTTVPDATRDGAGGTAVYQAAAAYLVADWQPPQAITVSVLDRVGAATAAGDADGQAAWAHTALTLGGDARLDPERDTAPVVTARVMSTARNPVSGQLTGITVATRTVRFSTLLA